MANLGSLSLVIGGNQTPVYKLSPQQSDDSAIDQRHRIHQSIAQVIGQCIHSMERYVIFEEIV